MDSSERPYKTIRRFARKNNAETKETVKDVFEKSDNLSLWIIGISLASISLLVSSFNDITKHITPTDLKVVFVSLFISVLCGVSCRIITIWFYILTNAGFRILDFLLADDERMETESSLDGDETFEDLVSLNSQFENMNYLIEKYCIGNDTTKYKMHKDIIASYLKNVADAKIETDETIAELNELNNKFLGIKKNPKVPSRCTLIFVKYTSIILYLFFMFSFVFAFGYFVFVIKIF